MLGLPEWCGRWEQSQAGSFSRTTKSSGRDDKHWANLPRQHPAVARSHLPTLWSPSGWSCWQPGSLRERESEGWAEWQEVP